MEAIKNNLQRLENKNNPYDSLQKDSLKFKDKKGISNEATGISNTSDNDPPRYLDSERHSMPVSSLSRPNFSERGSRNSQEEEGQKGG